MGDSNLSYPNGRKAVHGESKLEAIIIFQFKQHQICINNELNIHESTNKLPFKWKLKLSYKLNLCLIRCMLLTCRASCIASE